MAKRGVSGGRIVLPKAASKAGSMTLRSIDEMLTAEQRKTLRSDLSEMARRRREAEASSSTLRLS